MWHLSHLASVIPSALLKWALSCHQLLLGVGSDIACILRYLLWVIKVNLIRVLVANNATKFNLSIFVVDLTLVELTILVHLIYNLGFDVDIGNTWTLVLCRVFLSVHRLAVVDVDTRWVVLLLKERGSLTIQEVAGGLISPILLELGLHLLHACANTCILGVVDLLE